MVTTPIWRRAMGRIPHAKRTPPIGAPTTRPSTIPSALEPGDFLRASIGRPSGVAPLKRIGFTIAIFISALAFDEQALQEDAKLAILSGSALAAAIGVALLVLRHRARRGRAGPPGRYDQG